MEIFSFVNVIFTSSHTVEGFHGQNVLGVKIVNVKTQIELKFALINIAHFMTYIYWLWQELMEVYKKEVPRNSPLHSVRAGEDHIHKGENFHPRVVNCVSACTTITDKILTLSFFLLFFQQFWSWSCTASTTTQCLILTNFISFLKFGYLKVAYGCPMV